MGEESTPPPTKRKRTKGFIACDACQKRKSRCDLVSAGCCHRCRVLGTDCSFILVGGTCPAEQLPKVPIPTGYTRGISPLDPECPSQGETTFSRFLPPSFVPDTSTRSPVDHGRNDELSHRVSRMEALLETVLDRISRSAGVAPPVSSEPPTAAIPSDHGPTLRMPGPGATSGPVTSPQRALAYPCASDQIAEVFRLRPECRFLDPVADGLVTSIGLEEAVQVARSETAPFLTVDGALERPPREMHPFLQCCILYYASFRRTFASGTPDDIRLRSRLLQVVRVGLSTIHSAPPAADLALACLLLAMSPSGFIIHQPSPCFDPLGAVTVAHSLVPRLGLVESVVYLRQVPCDELAYPWHREHLHNMQIAYSSYHLYSWSHAFSSSSFTLPAPPECPLDQILSLETARTISADWLHLLYESRLLEVVRQISNAALRVRCARIPDPEAANLLLDSLGRFQADLEAWRTAISSETTLASATREWLHLQSLQIEMALSLKISTDASKFLPSPLGFEARFPVLPPFGNSIFMAARNIALRVPTSGLNLSMIPGFSLTLCFLAYAVIYQAHKLDQPGQDPAHVLDQPDHFSALRSALSTSHPAADVLLGRVEELNTDADWKRVQNLASELNAVNELSLAGFELFFDFDLASLGFPDSLVDLHP